MVDAKIVPHVLVVNQIARENLVDVDHRRKIRET